MKPNDFISLRDDVNDALRNRNLLHGLHHLEALAVLAGQPAHSERVRVLRRDYTLLLDCMKRGVDDTSREEYYCRFLKIAYSICDELERLYRLDHTDCAASVAWTRIHQPAESVADIYLPFVEGQNGAPATIAEILQDPLASYNQLFDTVWTSSLWSDDERREVYDYIMKGNAPYINRLNLVAAVGVALLFCFDERKYLLLLSVIEEPEVEVSVRALVFSLLAYTMYKDRIGLYPSIMLKFNFLSELPCFHPLVLAVQKALKIVLESPEESKTFDKTISADLAGLSQMKQAFDEIPQGLSEEEMTEYVDDNPELKSIRDNMFSRANDYAELVSQGVDMNYHSFSILGVSLPCFKEAANWFCPFSLDHPLLYNVSELGSFMGLVLKNRTCDTDRYALALSINTGNAEIRIVRKDADTLDEEEIDKADVNETLSVIRAEIEEAEKSIKQNGLLGIPRDILYRYVVSFVQDCYRFFTLYKGVGEDDDPFGYSLSFWRDPLFQKIFATDEEVRELADCVFSLEDYVGALELYNRLKFDADQHRRVGYCYDRLNEPMLALQHYRMSLELEPAHEWTERHLYDVCRNSDNYVGAIEVLLSQLERKPDDLRLTRQLAEMYMRADRYEDALSLLLKLDYLRPDHLPTKRALAWCHLNLSHYKQASDLYLSIVGSEAADANDLYNAGHCAMIQNDFASAVAYYQEYMRVKEMKFAGYDFFMPDIKVLENHGVSDVIMHLMADQLNL